jgi:hypothetical protein
MPALPVFSPILNWNRVPLPAEKRPMNFRAIQYLFFLIFLLVAPVWAGGIRGRVAWQGQLVPAVKVHAYRSVADIASGKAVATSAPTSLDGTYTLTLPAGEYYLTARDYEDKPRPGKHFCYYSGAPARVTNDSWTPVHFNLIRIPREAPPAAGEGTGIRGEITFQGDLLEKCYLYIYRDPEHGFKGPAYFVQPVEKGRFRLRLPPGDYWLLARKRGKGGQFGPIEIGDYFNFYHGNPLHLEAGQLREINIETITRRSMLEEEEAFPFQGFTGTVFNPGGIPAAGVRVFAYRTSDMTGIPEHFSSPTGADGRYSLSLPSRGPWYLLARESFGGPAAEGEMYGRYEGKGKNGTTLPLGKTQHEVIIHVEPKRNP